MDTIFAISTAPGKSGVAVMRLSGPDSHEVTREFAGTLPAPRELRLRRLRSSDGSVLDEALVVVFAPGESFTGEPVAEWHLHGSIAVQQAALAALGNRAGCRPAEPGEFTRRALENERLDLASVEGLADLVDAETEAQRQRALRALGGGVSAKVETWREKLVRAAALIEATIDFSEEEIPSGVFDEARQLLASVHEDLSAEIAGSVAAERIRVGYEVAIVGPPNVGKSTLLNRLAGREAAITSEIAGTTRDIVEVRMDIAGLAVTLLDSAGIRETSDPIESMGVNLARSRANAADLRIILVEEGRAPEIYPQERDLVVLAKADEAACLGDGVSGLTGAGVDELIAEIGNRLSQLGVHAGVLDRERHRVAAGGARNALGRALSLVEEAEGETELAAEEVRAALRALEGLLGYVGVESLLDEIFSSFCIGK